MMLKRPRTSRISALTATGLMAIASVGTIAPAIPLANAQPAPGISSLPHIQVPHIVGPLGQPMPDVQRAVTDFANQPWVPPQVRDALLQGLAFLAGTGEVGGPPLPDNAPQFRQAFWPTVSPHCMGPGLTSTGTAIAVPGPAALPAPAPKAGQATFVFTALGTKAAAPEQDQMNVYWVNLGTFRSGVTPLQNNGINPTGPATLSGVADTGSGTILAVVAGSVNTGGKSCGFAPTALAARVK
ncbi:Rv1157c family protein [Corynebacterium tuscaniense]|nr:hypothetical protein [Corynebacterium tuscaniense]